MKTYPKGEEWRVNQEWCIHYSGTGNGPVCRAGVEYTSVEQKDSGPFLERLPCFSPEGLHIPCAKRHIRTNDEAKAMYAESRARMLDYFKKITSDICPTCDKSMTPTQVGRSVYAEPCGHRLYQGKISEKIGGDKS